MDERKSWLRENWKTGLILALIVAVAAFLRIYFVYNEFAPAGYWTGGGDYSGGSDPFYWERALLYSFQTGKEISWDYAMNYPIGFPDVRPPLFDWFNLLAGYLVAPAFGSTWDAMVWMLNMNAAIFGVLALIPTYLIGKEAFNRRTGLLAAFLLAISAAALQRSHATIAVHDAWTLFFVICTFYFYLRALKTLDRRRWVESWFSRKSITSGLGAFFRENRKSVLYALLAGMSVGVTALSWQGWAYVPVILILIFLIEVILDRIRNQDVMGVTILFMLILATPLVVSFPWYAVRNLVHFWWDIPLYLFLIAAALGIVFTLTRDYPWTIVLPATFVAAGIGIVGVAAASPTFLTSILGGAGYFIKNKVYQTIAEAQEPGMSELVLNFGWFTFYVGLGAIAYMIWQTPRRNNPAFTMIVLWSAGALFMAISAARFIFNAAPIMSIATAYALDLILTRFGFAEMRRTYRSLSEGNWRNAVRKSVKPRHVIIAVLLALLIILPNAWFAVDSAIPYEQKAAFDKQIEASLPSFLQAPGYASTTSGGSTFYLGAFGYSLPTSNQYFPAAYKWLSTQDTNVPLEQRPAVMAWWDYGFEIAERGGHPVPADPFQNGYSISGQFILAQNESTAIALLAIRLIEGDLRDHGMYVSSGMAQLLTSYGIDPGQVNFAFRSPAALIPIILNNPNEYGLWSSTLTTANSAYIYLDTLFLSKLTENQVVSLYHDVRAYTGWSIGYFMLDTRLFPLSSTNTGIFYAPAQLSDHRTLTLANGQVMPYDFFQLFANTNTGSNIPLQYVPTTSTVTSTTIQYQSMFYNSMFYRAYVGYSPKQLGSTDTGIPGMDQALASYAPDPAWNLTHFRVVYRTAYYNPYTDATNHTSAWQAMNYDQAAALQAQISAGKIKGVVDMSTLTDINNGAIVLAYYDGAVVNGTVSVGGVPLAGIHLTVTDELGTPHMVTTTDAQGHYSAIVPFGNVTLTASVGTLNNQTLIGSTALATTTFHVTTAQANRLNQDLDGDGIPDWLITKNLPVPVDSLSGTLYLDLNHDGVFDAGDQVAAGANLSLTAANLNYTVNVTTDATGGFSATNLVGASQTPEVTYEGHTMPLSVVQASTTPTNLNLPIPFTSITGNTLDANSQPVGDANVTVLDQTNGTSWRTTSDAQGVYAFQGIFPGGYVLSGDAGNLASGPTYITVGSTATSQNLTLVPSGTAQGTTELFGTPFPFATLTFLSTSTTTLAVTATSDAQGHYHASLPAGDWNVYGRVYSGGTLYATLGRLTVQPGTATAFDANFVGGARVTGTVSAKNETGNLVTHIGFLGTNGEMWLYSGSGNTYLAYLPLGTYGVVASTASSVLTESVYVGGTMALNLALEPAATVSGTVYRDVNGNGVADPGEGIPGARVALTDAQGHQDVAVADGTGAFTIELLPNATYSGEVSATGFSPMVVSPTTAAGIGSGVHWALTPIPVTLSGTVYLNGTVLLTHPVTIRAQAEGNGAVPATTASLTDGAYSLSLVPGNYQLVVDENATAGSAAWRIQNLRTDALGVAVGEGQASHDILLAARALVKGNVTLAGVPGPATVSFLGPDNVTVQANLTGGFKTYLQAGAYVVGATRSVSGTEYAVLKNATLPVAGNVSLVLGPSAQVAGTAFFGGVTVTTPVTVTFTRLEGGSFQATTGATGNYTLALVPGNYTVTVDNATTATSGGLTRYYRYTFDGRLTVPPSTTSLGYDVALARALDNTTVAGIVTFAGGGADATIAFYPISGGALTATAAAAVNGSYAVSLAPGTYTVYATRLTSSASFLGTLTVPHASLYPYSFGLRPAYQISGVITDPNGVRVPASLTLQSRAALTLTTDAAGAYSVLVPGGSYVLTADRNQTEQGVLVSYQGTASLSLSTDTIVNVQLGRVDKRSVLLTWDPSQLQTINAGGSVTYSLFVENTGNVQDTYTFGGSGGIGWNFTFAPSETALNYGNTRNASYVSVTIQSPPFALVQHGGITILATSTTDSSARTTISVQVGIARTRGLTLQIDPTSGTFDGRYLNYTVNVRNTGNDAEHVDISIQNPSDIAASGWSPSLALIGAPPAGLVLTNLNVSANSTSSIRLVLRLSGAQGATTVALGAAAEDNAAVSATTVYTAVFPQLAVTSGIGVTGPGIATSLPPNQVLLAVIIGAVAAIGVGLYLTRRRR